MAERDDELWELVAAYEEAKDAAREIRQTSAALKQRILNKLGLAGKDGNFATRFRGCKRVRVVATRSTDFSITDLTDKYGEEFVEENLIERFYDTVEIKDMAKPGHEGDQS